MHEANILFLSQEDVIKSGVLDMKECLKDVEQALKMLGNKQIKNPPKTSINNFNKDGSWRSMNNSMPVYIGGEIDRAGIKWASESNFNIKESKLPMGIDILTLSDTDTVLPVSIMDATLITAMRTAANAIMAVKYLAPKSTTKIGIVGAGVIGRTMLMAVEALELDLKEVRIGDKKREKVDNLCQEFGNKLPMIASYDAEEAVKDADVVITATTAKKPIINEEWLQNCKLCVQSAQNEFPIESLKNADKITLDDWEQMMEKELTFKQLVDQNFVKRNDVSELNEIIAGKEIGRKDENQRIQHLSRGLACLDVMVGERIYQKAKEIGIGREFKLWDTPRWI